MQTEAPFHQTSEFSVRRTVLTLLGAGFAFGILTASYATAELPEVASAPVEAAVTIR